MLALSWVFTLMEYVGDYSENPFEGLINDIPLGAIVRNIEIDMLGEKNLPEKSNRLVMCYSNSNRKK